MVNTPPSTASATFDTKSDTPNSSPPWVTHTAANLAGIRYTRHHDSLGYGGCVGSNSSAPV